MAGMKKRRAADKKNYMVGINTWLFAIGAILVGYNTYINLPATQGDGGFVLGNFTQRDGIMLSSFAIMMAGFFYSLAILKPDMLKRHREHQLMKLKVKAAQHNDFVDPDTDLHNGNYFLPVVKSYLTEFTAANEILGLVLVEIDAPNNALDDCMKKVAAGIAGTARDYDVIARLDRKLLVVLTPYIRETDITSISDRYKKVLSETQDLPPQCYLSFGTAINENNVTTPTKLVEVAARNLQIGKRLNSIQIAA